MTADPSLAVPTATPAAATPAPTQAKARSNAFFRQRRTPLPHDEARRQGDISQLAFLTMGGRDAAIAFLNSDDAALGGRPLALATASDAGFAAVAAAIRDRAVLAAAA